MADTAAFIATLGLRLEGFEQELKRANALADRQLDEMERGFSARNLALGTALGTAIGGGIQKGVSTAISELRKFNEELLNLDRAARFSGASMSEIFTVGQVIENGQEAVKVFEGLASQLDRMAGGEKNFLSKLFDQFGVKNVKDAADAFERVRGIINSIRSEVQAREVGAGIGLSAESVDRIRRVGDGYAEAAAAARKAQPDLQKLADSAREFDEAWMKAVEAVKAHMFMAFGDGGELGKYINQFLTQTVKDLRQLEGIAAAIRNTLSLGMLRGKVGLAGQAADLIEGTLNRDAAVPIGTTGGGGAMDRDATFRREAKATKERADNIQRLIEAMTRSNEVQQAELRSLGLSNIEREKAVALAHAEAAARRAGRELTDEERTKVLQLAEAHAVLAETLKRVGSAQSEIRELSSVFSDAFKGMALQGQKLDEVLKNILNRLASSSIDKLFGLLFNGLASASGPGLASLFGGARAGGGPVAGGRSYLVGERGPEMFVPKSPGVVIPNNVLRRGGGQSVQHTFQINVAGTGNAEIDAAVQRGVRVAIQHSAGLISRYDRQLPSRMVEVQSQGY
jgi:hypothetical protein